LGYSAAMASPLALSATALVTTEFFGQERQPMLVIDGFLANPQAVLAIAARAPFGLIGPHYPGIRSPVPQDAIGEMIESLSQSLTAAFALPGPPRFHECFLSLVTVAPAALQLIQRLPHFDGVEPDRLALLLYLDRAETGGTAFYRQRSTGFESVDSDHFAIFAAALQDDVARHGQPSADYIRGDTAIYEQTFAVAGRFNRAIIYRGNTLHCAHLPGGFTPADDPLTGRLTLNLFLRATV
jgi:Family of unknown function (DUF6445)